jgi:hypothetical protein
MVDNPYANETATNTGDTSWLDQYKNIKADFHSLADYANNMASASMNLGSAQPIIGQIPQLSSEAFSGHADNLPRGGVATPFPEGQLVDQINKTNFFSLASMLRDLQIGLQNVGYAAQTVSDAYHLSDSTSARDLNSLVTVDGVDFAFAQGGQRPAGLSSKIGETAIEHRMKQQEADAKAGNAAQGHLDGLLVNDPAALDGQVEQSFAYLPEGGSVTVVRITYADGSTATKRIYNEGGHIREEVETRDAKGNVNSSAVKTTTGPADHQTVVTERTDAKGQKTTSTDTTTTSTTFDGPSEPTTTTTKTAANSDGTTTTATTTSVPHGPTTTVNNTTDSKGGTHSTTTATGDNSADVGDQATDPRNDPRYLPADQHNMPKLR